MRYEMVGGMKFEVLEVIRNGNREVCRVRAPSGEIRILKILGRKRPLPLDVAARQARQIEAYRKRLQILNIPLPEKTELFFAINGAGVELKELSVDVGTEATGFLSDLKVGQEIVEQIFKNVIKPLFSSTKGEILEVGLDPLTRNFTFNGKVCYVDLFPPKITVRGQKTLEFPEPKSSEARRLGLFRHYHKKGIILVFFMDCCRAAPAFRKKWEVIIRNFLQEIGEKKIIEFLESSPANVLHYNFSQAAEIIKAQSGRGISYFFLRDLACEIAFKEGKNENPRLEGFFQLTHFQDKPLSARQIEEAKEYLCEWASALNS
jgi:hypothetical protein